MAVPDGFDHPMAKILGALCCDRQSLAVGLAGLVVWWEHSADVPPLMDPAPVWRLWPEDWLLLQLLHLLPLRCLDCSIGLMMGWPMRFWTCWRTD